MVKKNKLLGFLVVLLVIQVGCAGIQTRKQIGSKEAKTVAHEELKEAEPQPEASRLNQSGPKVGLILGPGGVKAFAHTGVIKELSHFKVRPYKVIGIEWGALVAAMYSQSGKIHEVEWKLYKLKKESFIDDGIFQSGFEPQTIKKLQNFINETVPSDKYSDLEIPFECPAVSVLSGISVWQNRGSLKLGLKHCLPHPPLFKPQSAWMADIYALEAAIQKMSKEGCDLIIVVNVSGSGDLLLRKDQLPYASASLLWHKYRKDLETYKKTYRSSVPIEWIDVNTRQFLLYDFDKRNDIVLAGESVAKKRVQEIVNRYGL